LCIFCTFCIKIDFLRLGFPFPTDKYFKKLIFGAFQKLKYRFQSKSSETRQNTRKRGSLPFKIPEQGARNGKIYPIKLPIACVLLMNWEIAFFSVGTEISVLCSQRGAVRRAGEPLARGRGD